MRPIDADALYSMILDQMVKESGAFSKGKNQAFSIVKSLLHNKDATPTLTPPNEWVSVEERLPEPGERVIATDGAFVGEGYMDCYGVWCRPNGMRWNMLDSEVTHWIPLPALPDRRPPEGEEDTNGH